MKNMKTELFNLLKTAYQERDEARNQLQKVINYNLIPTTTPIHHLQEIFVPNPSITITESSSLSHGSPPVDSFFEPVSSPEFSNSKMGYLNNHHNFVQVQDFNYLNMAVPIEKPMCDPGTVVIDSLAAERVLPQKGKLLQAVLDSGPLLQTILLAGPLPIWRNPPPLQDIKFQPLNIKECDNNKNETRIIESISFPQKQKISSILQSSNGVSTCSASSMVNFAGNHHHGSLNNTWKFCSSSNSCSSLRIQLESRKRQRYQ